MSVTETAKLLISVPFRADAPEAAYPGCLGTFDARHIDRFLAALAREIGAVSAECDTLLIREIELANGSAAHFPADDLANMIRSVREHFRVDPKAVIRLTMTPSGFDFYKLSAVKQLGRAEIRFELPGLTEERLRRQGYRCTAEKAEEALNCCFQNGFRDFAVILTAKDMGSEEAEETLHALLAVHPKEIALPEGANPAFLQTADSILTAANWHRDKARWYRDAPPAPLPFSAQIGCGPNAVSMFDGVSVRSTADFDFYCAHSDDFEALVKHANT